MLDARGLSCPEPVVMIRKAMMSKAAEYVMVVDNPPRLGNAMRLRLLRESMGCHIQDNEWGKYSVV